MPRNEDNNPTERIGRLLEEFEELEGYVQQVVDMLPAELVDKLPPYPRLHEHHDEKVRRQFTLRLTHTKRSQMRRLRYGQRGRDNVLRQRGHQEYEPELDQEILDGAGLSEQVKKDLEKLIKEG